MTNREGTIISLTEQFPLFKYRLNTHKDPPWRFRFFKASVVSRTLSDYPLLPTFATSR